MEKTVITKIESSAKIEAFIGLCITTLMSAFLFLLNDTGQVPYEVVWGIVLFMVFFVVMRLLYYVEFVIQKWAHLKEQEQKTALKKSELASQIELAKLKKDILVLGGKQ